MMSAVLAASLVSCGDRGTEPTFPDVTQWVTGEALQTLDPDGHFALSPVEIPADRPVIDARRASELAVAYIQTVVGNAELIAQLQSERRGEPAYLDTAQPSSRVEVAVSPYETTPAEYGDATLRSRGSFYVVRFLAKEDPVVSVGVAAHATDVTIVDGNIRLPAQSGNEFVIGGDPAGGGFEIPISPEQATRIAAEATGAKIDQQPVLRRPEWLFSLFYSRWLLHLDRSVRFRNVRTGAVVEASSVYVGPALDGTPIGMSSLLLPQDTQPLTQNVSSDIHLRVRPGYPVWFDRVSVVR